MFGHRSFRVAFALAALCAVSACERREDSPAPTSPQQANYKPSSTKAVTIAGKTYRCVDRSDSNLSGSNYVFPTEYQQRLLSPEALNGGVQVYGSGSDVTGFGSVVLYYVDRDNTCVLWTESLSNQEFAERIGLTPLGLSPFYSPEKTAQATTSPTPVATPTPTSSAKPEEKATSK